MKLRPWMAAATLLVGLANLAGGIAHVVGVTIAALARHGVFDTRHTLLLTIGWTLIAPALAFLVAAAATWRERAWGYPLALVAAAFLAVEYVLLGAALGTPAQYLPAWAGVAAYLALAGAAWRQDQASRRAA